MAILAMEKISLIGLKQDKQNILQVLQRLGCVEIIGVDDVDVSEELQKIEDTISYLKDFRSVDKKTPFFDIPEDRTFEELQEVLKDEQLSAIIKQVEDIKLKQQEFDSQLTKIDTQIDSVKAFIDLDAAFSSIKDTNKTKIFIGSLDDAMADGFYKSIDESEINVVYEEIGRMNSQTSCFILVHNDEYEKVNQICKEYGFNKVSPKAADKTPREMIAEYNEEKEAIRKQQYELSKIAVELENHSDKLKELYDAQMLLSESKQAQNKLVNSDYTFVLNGWLPEKEIDKVKNKLSKFVYHLETVEPDEGEEAPVYTQNNKVIEPFQMVTNLYSSPRPYDTDPNPLMAPFFAIFFGIMLSDAMYGLILTLGAFLGVRYLKLKGETRQLATVIGISGLLTIFWGASFGGWFSDAIKIKPLLFNPIEEPMKMIVLSLVFGYVQVVFGLIIKMVKNIREKRVAEGIFDQGFWLMILFGFGVMILGNMVLTTITWLPMLSYILIGIGALGLLLTQGRTNKGIIGKLMGGLSSLYDVTGYFSDIISYIRLFALGLATGIIGMVVNVICRMLMQNWYTIWMAPIVFIGMHLFNMAINALGAFVHSARLQYIEFFPKFYTGGGKVFKPLSANTKYTNIYNKEKI